MSNNSEFIYDPKGAVMRAEAKARRGPQDRFTAQRLLARQGMDIQRQYAENFHDTDREIRMVGLGRNGAQVGTDIRTAMTDASRDVGIGAAGLERANRALGAAPLNNSTVRRVGLARALAEVDAGNRAGDMAEGRQKAAQQWGMQQWGADSVNATNILSNIAMSEQDRYEQYKRAKAQYRGGLLGGIGSIAGAVIGGIAGGGQGAMAGAQVGGSVGRSF